MCNSGGNVIQLRYDNYTSLLVADNIQHLQNLMNAAMEGSEVKDLPTNVRKRKTIVVSKTEILQRVENECFEQIDIFKYLGKLITPGTKYEKEIRARMAMTKGSKIRENVQTCLKSKPISIPI